MGIPSDDTATRTGGDGGETGSTAAINTPEDLRKGIIRSIKEKDEFTILLVGETGTGKTAMLKLLANVCVGNGPKNYQSFHDQSNEAGGNANSSQTKSAKLYEFPSREGFIIRILDTPGLADTRGLHQDKAHLASIAETISAEVGTVDAVIILANGTAARLGAATDYTLNKLSAMFPKPLSNNIVFLFTNINSPWDVNFEVTSLPQELRNNQRFYINNPVAIQEKILKNQNSGPTMYPDTRQDPAAVVDKAHSGALDVLARMFDLIDDLEPQPTKPILELYNKTQDIDKEITTALAAMDEAGTKKRALNEVKKELDGTKSIIELCRDYNRIITQKVHETRSTPGKHNTLCGAPKCFRNCHESCTLSFSGRSKKLWRCHAFLRHLGTMCDICGHSRDFHRHFDCVWVEVDDHQRVEIDTESKMKYESAQKDKVKKEQLTNSLTSEIARLDEKLCGIKQRISELVRTYAGLSLSGSFRYQVQRTILLLEVHLTQLHEKPTQGSTSIRSVEKEIEDMKRGFKLLEEVGGENLPGDTKQRLELPGEAVEKDPVEKDSNAPRNTQWRKICGFFIFS